MASAGSLFINIGARTAGLKSGLRSAQRSVQRTARKMERAGRAMSTALTLPLAAAGAGAVNMAADFDRSMNRIVGLVGIAREQVEAWKSEVRAMAQETATGPRELAEALFFVTSAGLRGEEALNALRQSAKAAAAGLGETKEVADAVTSVMNAYGSEVIDASQATDVLTKTVEQGKLQADELAGSIGRVIPIAAQMGVQFEDVGAAIATMTRTGTPASTAARQLRQVLVKMMKPSDQAKEAFQATGRSFEQVRKTIREDGLLAGLQMLQTAVQESGIQMTKLVPRARALTGVLQIVGQNSQVARDVFEELQNSAGKTQEAFRATDDTTRQLSRAWIALKNAGVELGQNIAAAITPLVRKITELLGRFSAMSERMQATVLAAGALTAALGPILFIGGKMLSTVAGLIGVLGTTGGLAAALGAAALASKEFRMRLIRIGSELVTRISRAWQEFGPKIKSTLSEALESAVKIFQEFSVAALQATDALLQFLTGNWKESWDSIVRATKTATTSILQELDKLETKTKVIIGGIGLLTAVFSGGWVPAILGAGTATASFASILGDSSSKAQEAMKTWGQFQKELGVTREEMLALGEAVDAMRETGIVPEFRSLKELLKPGEAVRSVENFIQRIKGAWQSFRSQFMGGPGGGGGGGQERGLPTAPLEQVGRPANIRQLTQDLPAQLNVASGEVERLKERLAAMRSEAFTGSQVVISGLKSMASQMGVAVQQAASIGDAFRNMGRTVVSALEGMITKMATFAAVAGVLSFIPGVGQALGLGSGFGSIFSGLLGLQHGGLVTGPTIAAVGEGPNVSSSNPEVVAPLDKLRRMLTGPGGAVSAGGARVQGGMLQIPLQVLDQGTKHGSDMRSRTGKGGAQLQGSSLSV